jgi:hypothetical protein
MPPGEKCGLTLMLPAKSEDSIELAGKIHLDFAGLYL